METATYTNHTAGVAGISAATYHLSPFLACVDCGSQRGMIRCWQKTFWLASNFLAASGSPSILALIIFPREELLMDG